MTFSEDFYYFKGLLKSEFRYFSGGFYQALKVVLSG